jgi:nucleotide-binding universal stress UspA family protein
MAAKSSRKVIKKAAKKAVKVPAQKPAKNKAKKAAVKAVRKGSGTSLLATGGGSAPAAGVTFQGWVGGLFAATGLTQAAVDKRFQLKAESIAEFRLETESPIDDLIVYTTAPGRLFVQAKTNLSMAQSNSDAMMRTLDQIVRQWRLCTDGKKARRWDYPLDKEVDRFVIAIGTEPEVEIPRVAQARGVDRLIVAFEDNPDLTSSRSATLVERILPNMGMPVCVIGRYANLSSPNSLKVNNVTLALSLNSDCRIHLGFASRLAQEANAKLTVLHVSECRNSDWDPSACSLDEVVSRLPFETWRESKVLCPSEIRICEGNPAEQILKHTGSGNAGPIVLCSSGAGSELQNSRNSVSYRVLAEAQCPVFILNRPVSEAEIVTLPEKASAVGKSPSRGGGSCEEVLPWRS